MGDDDEDVVLEGSALHEHLRESGFGEDLEMILKHEDLAEKSQTMSMSSVALPPENQGKERKLGLFSLMQFGEDETSKFKSVLLRATKLILDNKLLVAEDEDFLKDFINETQGSRSNPFNISPIIALLGAGVLYYVKPTIAKLVVPSILMLGAYKRHSSMDKQLLRSLQQLLQNLTLLQDGLRKSINFVKGMEMVNLFFKSKSQSELASEELSFWKLRSAVLKETVECIEDISHETRHLIVNLPLLDDFESSSYVANVSFEKFGLSKDEIKKNLSVPKLKEANNILLLMTSEFLRRFCLALLKDVRRNPELTSDLVLLSTCLETLNGKINCKSKKVNLLLDFSQAQGCLDRSEETKQAKENSFKPSHNVQIDGCCFHLQTCLLKLRFLNTSESSEVTSQSKEQLEEIVAELKLCLELLEESADSVKKLNDPGHENIPKLDQEAKETTANVPSQIIDESVVIKHDDEVFEAFIRKDEEQEASQVEPSEEFEEQKKQLKESKQTKRVLRELKTVLVEKEQDWKERERRALARMKGEDNKSLIDHVDQLEEKENLQEESQTEKNVPEEAFSDSSYCSSDEKDNVEEHDTPHILLNNQTLFRRPRKPLTAKRSRGPSSIPSLIPDDVLQSEDIDHEDNTKKDQKGRIVTINRQPLGFDGRLATEAALKRFVTSSHEECFGDSSDEDCE